MAEDGKLGRKDIYAAALIFIIALGIWNFAPKYALPEFSQAGQIRLALEGKAVQPYVAIAAALERQYASLAGMDASGVEAITSFLLSFPPLMLALSCMVLFIGLRLFGQGMGWAAFAVVLFAASLSSFAFLPGIYSEAQIACLLFSVSFACLALFAKEGKNYAALFASAAFALGSGYFLPAYGIASAALAAFLMLRARAQGARGIAPYGILLLACAAGVALSPALAKTQFSIDNVAAVAAFSAPFLLASASICACLAALGATGKEWLFLIAASIALFGIDASSGAALLLLPIAHGSSIAWAGGRKDAALAAAYALCFFTLAAVSFPLFAPIQALALAGLVAFVGPLVLHLYEYNARGFFSLMLFAILALAVFFAVLAQYSAKVEGYPQYLGKDFAAGLLFLGGSGADSVVALERPDAAAFYLPGGRVALGGEAEDALLSGKGIEAGSYIILTPSTVQMLAERGGFEPYYYAGNYSSGERQHRLFASGPGRLLSRELENRGEYALKDGAFVDSYGRPYANVPLSSMVFLLGGSNASDPAETLLVLSEGGAPPAFVGLAGGSKAKIAYRSGPVVILEAQ